MRKDSSKQVDFFIMSDIKDAYPGRNVFFPPKSDDCNINIDLKSYATKAEVKAITGVDTSSFAKKTDFTKIKESVKKNSADYEEIKKKIDGIKPGSGSVGSAALSEFLKINQNNMMIAMGQVYFTPEDPISNMEIYIPYLKYYKLSTIPHIRLWESSGWDKKSLVSPPTSVLVRSKAKILITVLILKMVRS